MQELSLRDRRLAKRLRAGKVSAMRALPFIITRNEEDDGYSAPVVGSAFQSFDGKSATARFVISSETKDSYGDVIHSRGCLPTMSRYAANPLVAFNHMTSTLTPIGSSYALDGTPGVTVEENRVLADVKFHLKTKLSEEVCVLVEAGELRGASIGLLPEKIMVKNKDGDVVDANDVIHRDRMPYYDIKEWSLYEWSVVTVPANPDCVRLRLEKGIGGKRMSPELVRSFMPFYSRRSWANGFSAVRVAKPIVLNAGPDFDAAVDARVKQVLEEKAAAEKLIVDEAVSKKKILVDKQVAQARELLQEIRSFGGVVRGTAETLAKVTGKILD